MPNEVGRPTKYDHKYCAELIEHMRQGLSFESFAGKIEVSKQTIYTWKEKYPEFLEAKNKGEELSRLWWETLVGGGAAGRVSGFNAVITIFALKNKFHEEWRDMKRMEHSGPDGKPIETINRTKESIKTRLKEITEELDGYDPESDDPEEGE